MEHANGWMARAAVAAALVMTLVIGGFSAHAQNATGPDETRIALLQAKPEAYAIVEAAGRNEQPRVRLAALEAALHAPDAAYDLALSGLSDENPAVRFAALVTIGKLRITRLADAAGDLMKDDNESVRAAAMFAATRCGRSVDLSPLAGMLASGRPSARANAAMLIGQLGDQQAIAMLRDMAAKPMPRVSSAERTWVRLQFAEAIIRLDPDDADTLGSVRAAMYSNLQEVRVLSMQILGEAGDRSVRAGLAHIVKRDNPIQVKIAAAQALARMGDGAGQKLLLEASQYDAKTLRRELQRYIRGLQGNAPEAQVVREILDDPALQARAAAEVRAQAAVALGWLDSKAAVTRLTSLLKDADPIVKVAAASAILSGSRS